MAVSGELEAELRKRFEKRLREIWEKDHFGDMDEVQLKEDVDAQMGKLVDILVECVEEAPDEED